MDCAGVCDVESVLSGCDNLCNSTAVVDCADVCGGDEVVDECGVCDGDGSNDNITCEQDCNGVWGGDAVLLLGNCYGIETIEIVIVNSQVDGEILSEIGQLTNLTTFVLSDTQLT